MAMMNKQVQRFIIALIGISVAAGFWGYFKLCKKREDYEKFNGVWEIIALKCSPRVEIGESPLGMTLVCAENLSIIEWEGKQFEQRKIQSTSSEELGRTYNLIVGGFDHAIMIEYRDKETLETSVFNVIINEQSLYLLMGGEEYTRGIYTLGRQGKQRQRKDRGKTEERQRDG